MGLTIILLLFVVVASLQAQWKQMNPLTFLVQYQQKILAHQMVRETDAVKCNLDCIHRNEHTILYILP